MGIITGTVQPYESYVRSLDGNALGLPLFKIGSARRDAVFTPSRYHGSLEDCSLCKW